MEGLARVFGGGAGWSVWGRGWLECLGEGLARVFGGGAG